MYAIAILWDSSQIRKSIAEGNANYSKLNSTLGFSKHIVLPETLTWRKKGHGHDILNFEIWTKSVWRGGGRGAKASPVPLLREACKVAIGNT